MGIENRLDNKFYVFQLEKKTHLYKRISPYMVSIQKKGCLKTLYKKMQFCTILFPYIKCTTVKRTYVTLLVSIWQKTSHF